MKGIHQSDWRPLWIFSYPRPRRPVGVLRTSCTQWCVFNEFRPVHRLTVPMSVPWPKEMQRVSFMWPPTSAWANSLFHFTPPSTVPHDFRVSERKGICPSNRRWVKVRLILEIWRYINKSDDKAIIISFSETRRYRRKWIWISIQPIPLPVYNHFRCQL